MCVSGAQRREGWARDMQVSVICTEVAAGTTFTERMAPFGPVLWQHCFSHSPASFVYPVSYVHQAPGPQMPVGFRFTFVSGASWPLGSHAATSRPQLLRALVQLWCCEVSDSPLEWDFREDCHSCGFSYFKNSIIILFFSS